MTDDLVTMLRKDFSIDMKHEYPQTCLTEYEYERQKAADRIEKLEAALRELSCKCTSNCDWERGDICPSWIACKALEGKDD